jgi:hypothetical protein
MKRIPFLLIGMLLLPSGVAFAEEPKPSQEACYTRAVEELVNVHDEYRSYVFGSRKDSDGTYTVLTGGKTDKERTGIFETRRRLSSELVEPLIEAYRTYRCRSLAVCQTLGVSINHAGSPDDPFALKILGCTEQEVHPYRECVFTEGSDQFTPLRLLDQCTTLVEKTLTAERFVLRLAVGYDAGYRSLLQYSGIMDWMLEGFPKQAVKAISSMVNMLGKLHQIPCFIGQCDEPNSKQLQP